MINYIKSKRFVLIAILIGLMLSMFVLETPKPVSSDNLETFSAIRAQRHIKEITKKPHSYYDRDELEEVRVYLKNTLNNYLGNNNVHSYNYTTEELKDVIPERSNHLVEYPIENIVGVIPGENEEGILLMAHYDSRGHAGRLGEFGESYGAMDDGYGVGSLLELAYILKDINPKNSIYFLFTDAEEVGLFGAYMQANNESFTKNIKFTINLESRGKYGPAYMFETSSNNEKVIDLYKNANMPVSYSIATAVYNFMPNFTDFTAFVEKDIPGINFANLAGLDYYHSPLDKYENIDLSTIQHMGTQTEPIVREFANNEKYIKDDYFKANNDQVFFTIFANVFITYKQTTAIVLAILLLLSYIGIIIIKKPKFKTIKNTLLKGLLLTFITLLSTYILTLIIAFLGKTEFSITYVRIKGIDPLAFIIISLITILLFVKTNKEKHINNTLFIGTTVNVLLTLITTFTVPGASFIFLLPSIFGILSYVIKDFDNKLIKQITFISSYIILMLLIIPIIFSFYMALTIGGLTILVLLIILNAIVTMPIMQNHLNM